MRPPSILELVPFGAMLLSLSILPSFVPQLWERRKFRLVWALSLAGPSAALSVFRGAGLRVVHELGDYVDLVALMSALVVISGGIALAGTLEGTPAVNVILLAIGAVLASVIGAPSASTLMIRPYLHANRRRERITHGVIFLIMLSANIGGLLLPVGPPLYLGYLSGVPFFWTLTLWKEWVFIAGLLLLVFFVWDLRRFRREGFVGEDQTRTLSAIRVLGVVNLPILLAAILATALLSGPLRPVVLILCAVLSWRLTPPGLHERNRFTFEPIEEIVVIFFAIFATISPALDLLSLHATRLSMTTPRAFFWASGGFSAILDNAPTYLAAFAAAHGVPPVAGAALVGGIRADLLRAISLGAVSFGALTYVGNGPNLLVRSIAISRGVRMPGFVLYTAIASAVLLPIFVAVSFVFF